MELYEAIKGRRSVRQFTGEHVSDEVLKRLLEAACQAPSAGNLQPWHFYVIRKEDLKKEIAWDAHGQFFIAEAPVVVVVCADLRVSASGYGQRGVNLYALQDTAAAIQNLLLAVHAEGLGACWVGAFDEQMVKKSLGLVEDIRPVAIIPIGHTSRIPSPRSRKSFEQVSTFLY
jgi:nitroreductase